MLHASQSARLGGLPWMPAPHAPQHLIGDGRRMRHVYARTCPVFLHFVQRDECLSPTVSSGEHRAGAGAGAVAGGRGVSTNFGARTTVCMKSEECPAATSPIGPHRRKDLPWPMPMGRRFSTLRRALGLRSRLSFSDGGYPPSLLI